MTEQLTSGVFLTDTHFTDEMREEIERLHSQGMSNGAIAIIIGTKYKCTVSFQPIEISGLPDDAYMSYEPFSEDVSYAPFTEYGKPPISPSDEYTNIVEGSIVEPIVDERKLIN